jgi:hypothetical protein
MFYSTNIQDTRRLFYTSWAKFRANQLLEPLEQQLVDVILIHPEYHPLLELTTPLEDLVFPSHTEQANPFLHLGLHLAIRDQVKTNRPQGIASIYQQLLTQYQDLSTVEHLMMEQFAFCLWQAQRDQVAPDEQSYLQHCQQLLGQK